MEIGVFMICCVIAIACATDMHSKDDQMNYLMKYNYMGESNPMLGSYTDEDAFPIALRYFQEMAGLPATGRVDSDTIKMMEMKRCGVKDIMSMSDMAKRKKRYAPQGSKWPKNNLRYKITKYPADNDLSRSDVDTDIARAFDVWASVSPLRFRQVTASSVADIEVSFEPRQHGDGNDFDGAGGTLAHAFFPQWGGTAHMDEAEKWTRQTYQGTNLFQVAAHEFGHSLGLGHSKDQSALMAPFYRGYNNNFELHADDIAGIQHIYGKDMPMEITPKPQPKTTTTMRPMGPDEVPEVCRSGVMDDIFMTSSNIVYSFSGAHYSVLGSSGINPGYPRPINWDWPGLPDNIDAAVSIDTRFGWVYNYNSKRWSNTKLIDERIYFFKGDKVYRFSTARRLVYAKDISEEFPGLPNNIDSAFVWSGNGKLYFTKGEEYYRFRFGDVQVRDNTYIEVGGQVDAGYPYKLAVWKGLPSTVDAVFKWRNGRTYFFSGQNYYRFNDNRFRVDSGYPYRTTQYWYGCTEGIEQDDTMTMEKDMMNEDQFMEATMEPDTSGQSMSAPLSMAVCILTAVIGHLSARF